MKISNKVTVALLALGVVAQASADPVVYITGSTAFRSTAMASLLSNAGTNSGGVFDPGTITSVTYGNSNPSGANYGVFHGTINGQAVYINVVWSGSEAGVASAANTALVNTDRSGNPIPLAGSPATWLNVTNVVLQSGNNTIASNPAANLLESSSHGADLAQADTSQAVSWTPYVANTPTALKDFGVEGVITFAISRNNQEGNTGSGIPSGASNEWIHCSNITLPQLQTLLANGEVPAGFISGNTNDNDFTVYCVGRNLGSGTRMNTLGGSHYGTHNPVQQYSIGYGIEEPTHLNSLILTNEGNNGYESGGDVAKALGIVTPEGSCQQADPYNGGIGWFAMGYISPSDALNTGNFGGAPTNVWVTVDGVPSSNATIENGTWWLWGREHLLGKENISGTALFVGNTLFSSFTKYLSVQGMGVVAGGHDPAIQLGLMNVHKNSDTEFPQPGQ